MSVFIPKKVQFESMSHVQTIKKRDYFESFGNQKRNYMDDKEEVCDRMQFDFKPKKIRLKEEFETKSRQLLETIEKICTKTSDNNTIFKKSNTSNDNIKTNRKKRGFEEFITNSSQNYKTNQNFVKKRHISKKYFYSKEELDILLKKQRETMQKDYDRLLCENQNLYEQQRQHEIEMEQIKETHKEFSEWAQNYLGKLHTEMAQNHDYFC